MDVENSSDTENDKELTPDKSKARSDSPTKDLVSVPYDKDKDKELAPDKIKDNEKDKELAPDNAEATITSPTKDLVSLANDMEIDELKISTRQSQRK